MNPTIRPYLSCSPSSQVLHTDHVFFHLHRVGFSFYSTFIPLSSLIFRSFHSFILFSSPFKGFFTNFSYDTGFFYSWSWRRLMDFFSYSWSLTCAFHYFYYSRNAAHHINHLTLYPGVTLNPLSLSIFFSSCGSPHSSSFPELLPLSPRDLISTRLKMPFMFGLVVVRFVWMVLIIHLGVFNDLHTFPINHMDSGCRTVMMFLYGDCGLSHEGSEYTSDYTPHDLLIHIRRSREILTTVRRLV